MKQVYLDKVKPMNLRHFSNLVSWWAWYIHPATYNYPIVRKMFWASLNGQLDSEGNIKNESTKTL